MSTGGLLDDAQRSACKRHTSGVLSFDVTRSETSSGLRASETSSLTLSLPRHTHLCGTQLTCVTLMMLREFSLKCMHLVLMNAPLALTAEYFASLLGL